MTYIHRLNPTISTAASTMTKLQISVVYALPEGQEVITLRCPLGSTIEQAIMQSKICDKHPQIDITCQEVGVYGLKQSLDFILHDDDRVEIYRPLSVSPTEARRLRAQSSR